MLLDPHSNAWFEHVRGSLVYKTVTGSFALTTDLTDPAQASNGQMLSILGQNANIPADANPIPEPTTAALLALATLAILRRQRRCEA